MHRSLPKIPGSASTRCRGTPARLAWSRSPTVRLGRARRSYGQAIFARRARGDCAGVLQLARREGVFNFQASVRAACTVRRTSDTGERWEKLSSSILLNPNYRSSMHPILSNPSHSFQSKQKTKIVLSTEYISAAKTYGLSTSIRQDQNTHAIHIRQANNHRTKTLEGK